MEKVPDRCVTPEMNGTYVVQFVGNAVSRRVWALRVGYESLER